MDCRPCPDCGLSVLAESLTRGRPCEDCRRDNEHHADDYETEPVNPLALKSGREDRAERKEEFKAHPPICPGCGDLVQARGDVCVMCAANRDRKIAARAAAHASVDLTDDRPF